MTPVTRRELDPVVASPQYNRRPAILHRPMRSQKTETLTVRLAPDIKAALREAADREHRSLANMLEIMIRDCRSRQAASASIEPPTLGPGAVR